VQDGLEAFDVEGQIVSFGDSMSTARLRDIAIVSEELCPSIDVTLRDVFAGSNGDADITFRVRAALRSRVARAESVALVRIPVGAHVYGYEGVDWLLTLGNTVVLEQMSPGLRDAPDKIKALTLPQGPVVPIDGEVLLVARYGDGTWGHWLIELLPKIALCERFFPDRFSYAVPNWVLDSGVAPLSSRIREAIHAYGVDERRLLKLEKGASYRFSQLSATTPVWSDRILHPDVVRVFTEDVKAESVDPTRRKVALLRGDNSRRQIANIGETIDVLRKEGFETLDIAKMAFCEQVAIFRTATTVFSILGSGLSGLVYSPECVGVIAAAPHSFTDVFFTGLLQLKHAGLYAEVRGPVLDQEGRLYRDLSFDVPPDTIERTIAAMYSVRTGDWTPRQHRRRT
jgi:hypothetical protein